MENKKDKKEEEKDVGIWQLFHALLTLHFLIRKFGVRKHRVGYFR